MNSKGYFLLPLYYVSKQTRSKFIRERSLIYLIVLTSVVSIIIIFRYLPSSNSHDDEMKHIFVPQFFNNQSDKLFHKNNIEHKMFHQNQGQIKNFNALNYNSEEDKIDNNNNKQMKIESDFAKHRIDKEILAKRNFIKNMTLHAWNGYKTFAWGKNELKPISKRGHSAGIFGGGGGNDLGASIVDALDTLYIMGFEKEFADGKDWIVKNLNLNINVEYSTFEVNIRFIGGLIALHSLSGEKVFLDKAEEIAILFLPIFDSPSGIPYSLFNPKTKNKRNYNWASGSCSILAEFGSLSLEFNYLSDLTGKEIYRNKVNKIFKVLEKVEDNGLYYNYINPNSGKWCNRDATLGALADSFYEYLIKLWVYGNKKDDKLLQTFLKSMKAAQSKLIGKSLSGLTFAGEYSGGRLQYKMGHLACFSGGMFALTAMQVKDLSPEDHDNFKNLAIEITRTCHESYIRSPTHIGPESFHFNSNSKEAVSNNDNEKYYILRPEVVEAYFYLWRMTKDNKYREWAWDAAMAIEKHCRTNDGYSGIRNVYDVNSSKDDVQQSFFFAETLKYLYLIFSDDDTIPFDKYVFNTEAHPMLINKSN